MEMANPLLESLGELPEACVTNSSPRHTPVNLKGKGNSDMSNTNSTVPPVLPSLHPVHLFKEVHLYSLLIQLPLAPQWRSH